MSTALPRSLRRRPVVAGLAAAGLIAPAHAQKGDTLRIVHVGTIEKLNPLKAADDVGYIVRALFPPLTQFAKATGDPRLGWTSLVASPTDVHPAAGSGPFWIDIRTPSPPRRWSGGRENSAEEIKRGLEFARTHVQARPQHGLTEVTGFRVIDSSICRVELRARDTRLFKGTFPRPWASPMTEEIVTLLEHDPVTKPFNGLGPYLLKEFVPGERLQLTLNTSWNAKKPMVGNVHVAWMRDADTALAMLAAHECDVVRLAVDRLETNLNEVTKKYGAGIATTSQVVDAVVYIGMDVDDSTTNQRTAARAAISPSQTARLARGEAGAMPTSELVPASLNAKPRSSEAAYDPGQAKALLVNASGQDSRRVRLHALRNLPAAFERTMQAVAQQLTAVGFEVQRVPLEPGQPRPAGPGLSLFLARTPVVRDPPMAFEAFLSRSPLNSTRFSSETLDALFSRAVAASSERDALISEMQRAVDARSAAIPLYQERVTFLHRSWLRPTVGADGHLGDLIDFTRA